MNWLDEKWDGQRVGTELLTEEIAEAETQKLEAFITVSSGNRWKHGLAETQRQGGTWGIGEK